MYTARRRVEFHQTDAAGLMHFSAFFTMMEEAEHEFLRHLGLSVLAHDDQGKLSWPRVAAQCEFSGPLRFEEEVAIDVLVSRLGETSVTYGFTVRRAAPSGGDKHSVVARGSITAVCCRFQPDGTPLPSPIPEPIRQKLSAHAAP
jgi:4-hydroxybenzoyl-CoA thioesterase/acyl-CoA thioester hydrolase